MKPQILLPANGKPKVVPPSPRTSPEVAAFCRVIAQIIARECVTSQPAGISAKMPIVK